MLKYLISLLLVASFVVPSEYNYNLKISLKRNPETKDLTGSTTLNDKVVTCSCGKVPVFIMFSYGNPEFYCFQHIPEIEYVKPITSEDVDGLLKSLESLKVNRAHNG